MDTDNGEESPSTVGNIVHVPFSEHHMGVLPVSRLSTMIMRLSGFSASRAASELPIKPAPPVTRIFVFIS